ncbi:hypothetical protein Cgig2_002200 [Carnegiea gigantea]|uniref:Uncharacterized protein n=1 Tax=Carnegiea gigantea TaxID=171969 RepID=A0A9Q1KV81_9CARY|nr:hypothetical protein Cgig2_002200 [Carnegiea gigantea]
MQREKAMREHYIKLLTSVIDIIRQQCKAKWITYGDDCTRYFFARAKQRKTTLYIYKLQDEQGRMVQGFPVVATIMQNYYKRLLGEQNTQRRQIDPHLAICAPFTEKNIKTAIFSIPNTKSPGPYGFSSGFFKTTWHITGGMVIDAIQQFFLTEHMPDYLGETKLVLIPKVKVYPYPTAAMPRGYRFPRGFPPHELVLEKNWWLSRTFSAKASLTALHSSGKEVGTTLFKKPTSGSLGRWNIGDEVRLYGLELQLLGTYQQPGCSSTKGSLSTAKWPGS